MRSEKGFTLVELMVTLAIMAVVMAGVYSAYYSQQQSYIVQEQVSEMQQNLRGAMYFMAKEIRMAGCNPTGGASAGIVTAGANTINFTMDLRGKDPDDPADGDTADPNENITYILYDSDGDGTNDALGRDTGTGNRLVAQNVDAIDFVYLDENGNVTASLLQIRTVQITIVAKTGRADRGYRDTTSYTNLQGTEILAPPNDNFRRKRLATNIKCRNLGLLQE